MGELQAKVLYGIAQKQTPVCSYVAEKNMDSGSLQTGKEN